MPEIVKDTRWIDIALSDMEKSIDMQGEQLGKLEARLFGCLSQSTAEQKGVPSPELPGQSPIYMTLSSLRDKIDQHTRVINDLLERVEL